MGQAMPQQGQQSSGIAQGGVGVLAGQGDAAGGAEPPQAQEGVGHGVDAIAQVHHQLRLAAAALPEVVPQDRRVEAIEVVGHQHAAVQQGPSSGATAANTGAEEARASSMPCTAAFGMGTPGLITVVHSCWSSPSAESSSRAISTMRQSWPVPVVSRSTTAKPLAPGGSSSERGQGTGGTGMGVAGIPLA